VRHHLVVLNQLGFEVFREYAGAWCLWGAKWLPKWEIINSKCCTDTVHELGNKPRRFVIHDCGYGALGDQIRGSQV
jgi:hypothetical protein